MCTCPEQEKHQNQSHQADAVANSAGFIIHLAFAAQLVKVIKGQNSQRYPKIDADGVAHGEEVGRDGNGYIIGRNQKKDSGVPQCLRLYTSSGSMFILFPRNQ